MHHLIALLVLTLLAACQTQPTQESSPLAGTHWQLVEIQSMDDSIYKPDVANIYSLKFEANQGAQILAACNRGAATWQSEGAALEFNPFILTRMACPQASLESRYTADLNSVRSFLIRDDHLYLATFADGAIMKFSPIAPECSTIQDGRTMSICSSPELSELSQRAAALNPYYRQSPSRFHRCTITEQLDACLKAELQQLITGYEIERAEKPVLVNYLCTDESKMTVRFYEKTEIPAAVLSRAEEQRIVHLNKDQRYSGDNVVFWNRRDEASVKWDGTRINCQRN